MRSAHLFKVFAAILMPKWERNFEWQKKQRTDTHTHTVREGLAKKQRIRGGGGGAGSEQHFIGRYLKMNLCVRACVCEKKSECLSMCNCVCICVCVCVCLSMCACASVIVVNVAWQYAESSLIYAARTWPKLRFAFAVLCPFYQIYKGYCPTFPQLPALSHVTL